MAGSPAEFSTSEHREEQALKRLGLIAGGTLLVIAIVFVSYFLFTFKGQPLRVCQVSVGVLAGKGKARQQMAANIEECLSAWF